MHTILGAGGPVANSLTKVLLAGGEAVRLVSRKPISTSANSTWVKADLKSFTELRNAAEGSTVIYMCAGLQYNKKIWSIEWPLIMQNIIDVAKHTGARLIFFDNVYMYGLVKGEMTEQTPYNPCSKKGEVRAQIAVKLLDEAKAGNIRATIARAADFYGSESMNSFFDSMVVARYAKKQKAMWLGNVHARHSFTYVPDTGSALYTLSRDPQSDNQVWHLPTPPPMTGIEYLQLVAKNFGMRPGYTRVNKFMLHAMGVFNKLIGETAEMYYQYQYDYIFSSAKFDNAYKVAATPFEQGIRSFSKLIPEPRG